MLIALVILAAVFVLLNGVRCVRWLRRHDRLSLKWLKRLRQKSGSQTPHPAVGDQMTHANPHTQSPKMQSRGNVAGPQVTTVGTAIVAAAADGGSLGGPFGGADGLRIQRMVSTGTTGKCAVRILMVSVK